MDGSLKESGYSYMLKKVEAEIEEKRLTEEAKRQFREYMYGEAGIPYMDRKCRELFK
jgi:hypothetical protein